MGGAGLGRATGSLVGGPAGWLLQTVNLAKGSCPGAEDGLSCGKGSQGTPGQINEGSQFDESLAGPGDETLAPKTGGEQEHSCSLRARAKHISTTGARGGGAPSSPLPTRPSRPSCICCPYCTGEETEAWGSEGTCPMSHSDPNPDRLTPNHRLVRMHFSRTVSSLVRSWATLLLLAW